MTTVRSHALTLRAKILGALIREARLASGKSIEECAQSVGVPPAAFEAYELGDQAPSLPELEAISFTLDVPLERFFETQPHSQAGGGKKQSPPMSQLVALRHRMVGAMLRQARLDAGVSLEKLSEWCHVGAARLEAYELGMEPVPLPQLELISGLLNRSIREFQDRHGPVGQWATQQRAVQEFLTLPVEMQEFVSKPINRPYLELAQRLSDMSVDKLRAVAEGLLEITY